MANLSGNYGFIGLGQMGFPMASNLRKKIPKESTLYVNDVDQSAVQRFVQEHESYGPVKILSSAKEITEHSDVIFSIVPKGYHVKLVYLDETTGVIAANTGSGKKIFFEMSTIEASITREVGKKIEEAGFGTYFDSPISGGVPGAKDGTLSFMIGYPPDGPLKSRIEAIAGTMGRPDRIFFCGNLGNALSAKVANNYIAVINLLATAEAMNIGIRSGIDKHTMYNIIHNSTGQSFMGDIVCPVPGVVKGAPASNGYALGFRTEMMPKDLGLALDQAREVGAPLVLGEPTIDLYRRAGEDPRCKGKDGSSIWLFMDGPVDEEYKDKV